MTPEEFFISRAMLEGAICLWYRGKVRSQEHTTAGTILEQTEEAIDYTDLGLSPYWGVGLPRGHFRGSTLARPFPCGCETWTDNA